MDIQLFQHHLLRTFFSHWIAFCISVKNRLECICVDLFLGSLLVHWSMCLSLCQYHIVLIAYKVIFNYSGRDFSHFILHCQNCFSNSRAYALSHTVIPSLSIGHWFCSPHPSPMKQVPNPQMLLLLYQLVSYSQLLISVGSTSSCIQRLTINFRISLSTVMVNF